MNFLMRPLMKSKGYRRGLIAIVAILIVGLTGSLAFEVGKHSGQQDQDAVPRLPVITTHTPLAASKPLTFDQSLAITDLPTLNGYVDSTCPNLAANWMQTENAIPSPDINMGKFFHSYTPWPEGSALWLNKTSIGCGESVDIHASLSPTYNGKVDNQPRIFEAIRIGWYGGAGGRVTWTSSSVKLKYRKTPLPKNALRMIQTTWPTTLRISTASWLPGFYLIVSKLPNGNFESSAPLIIRAPYSNSTLALVHSTLTWAAYNTFGGRSLYVGPGLSKKQKSYERSRIVSMDRPLAGSGNELLFRDALPIVQLAEKNNISLNQYADTDINNSPTILSHFSGVVWSGHPEYWTQTLFDAAIAARNHGINLAFFGANTAYWRARLQPSPTGPDRQVIVYREATEDPAKIPADATLQFQDRIINEPPSLIDGSMTSAIGVSGELKSTSDNAWLGIPKNSVLKGFSKYSEIASHQDGIQAPTNVHSLFKGKFIFAGNPNVEELRYKKNSNAETDWWSAPSGAIVFSAGVNLWVCNLTDSCGMATVDSTTKDLLDTITVRVLTLWSHKINPSVELR